MAEPFLSEANRKFLIAAITAAAATAAPVTTYILKQKDIELEQKKWEHESKLSYIERLVSTSGQTSYYYRRDVLKFYSKVLPESSPVRAWADEELQVVEQKTKELDQLRKEQQDAKKEAAKAVQEIEHLATSQEEVPDEALDKKRQEAERAVEKAKLLEGQLHVQMVRAPVVDLGTKSENYECVAEVVERKTPVRAVGRAAYRFAASDEMNARADCDGWAQEHCEQVTSTRTLSDRAYCYRSLKKGDGLPVVHGALPAVETKGSTRALR